MTMVNIWRQLLALFKKIIKYTWYNDKSMFKIGFHSVKKPVCFDMNRHINTFSNISAAEMKPAGKLVILELPRQVNHMFKSNQITFIVTSSQHSALVSEILESVLQTVQKRLTYRQYHYILTDLYRQCAIYTYIITQYHSVLLDILTVINTQYNNMLHGLMMHVAKADNKRVCLCVCKNIYYLNDYF